MKSISKLWIVTLFFLMIMLYRCGNAKDNTNIREIGIPFEEMNKDFRLSAPDGWNNFTMDDSVSLIVEVISENEIAFTADYGARMFLYEDQQWIEVQNKMKYPEGHLLLTPAKGDPFKWGNAGMNPILVGYDKPISLRIILIGNIYRDGQVTEEQVAAYIDVELKP